MLSSEVKAFLSNLRYSDEGIYYHKQDKRKRWEASKLATYLLNEKKVPISELPSLLEEVKNNRDEEPVIDCSKLYSGKDRDFKFVSDWILKRKSSISDTGEILKDGFNHSVKTILADIIEYNNSLPELGCTKENMKHYTITSHSSIVNSLIDKAIEVYASSRRAEITNKLRYTPSADTTLLEKIFSPYIDTKDPIEMEAYLAGIKHWMWQVKRKMMLPGSTIINHLMIVLFGDQNKGKGRFIEAFVSPWEGLAKGTMKLQEALDPRNMHMHCSRAILNIDELAGMDKSEIETIKSFITTNEPKIARLLGTNIRENIVINSSLIGSTNRHIIDIIFDSSGMRRFLEIPFEIQPNNKGRPQNISDEEIEYIRNNAADLWRSVNENGESPINYNYHPIYFKVKEIQDRQIRKDTISQFLIAHDLLLKQDEIGHPIHINRLYEPFRKWLRKNGYVDMGKDTFIRMIRYSVPIVDEDRILLSIRVKEVIPGLEIAMSEKEKKELKESEGMILL